MQKGIHNLDTWEEDYVLDLPCHEAIAWTDEEAYVRYSKHNWAYDKFVLSQDTVVHSTWLIIDKPAKYPVFIKPRVNLQGMGELAMVAYSKDDLPKGHTMHRDVVAQEILEGDHISTDIAIVNKEMSCFSFLCHKHNFTDKQKSLHDGSFSLFESTPGVPQAALYIAKKLIAEGYDNAMLNVETIGGKIIDVHLRPSTQFYDICGGLISAAVSDIAKGTNHLAQCVFEKTYSMVWRREEDARPSAFVGKPAPAGVRSVQYTWEHGKKLSQSAQDHWTYRYLVVNGTDLEAVTQYGMELQEFIKFGEIE